MKKENPVCPRCRVEMELNAVQVTVPLKGSDLTVDAMKYVCPDCGLETDTLETVGALLQAIEDAFRKHSR